MFASRIQQIKPFRVMQLLARAHALQRAGHDVVHLEVGEPDFPTAAPIVHAGQQALADGLTAYTEARGLPALREAIAADYAHRLGVTLDPGRVQLTAGASGALMLLAALLLEPGDELLMTDPCYPCNSSFLSVVNALARAVPVTAAQSFQLDAVTAEAHWGQRTRGLLLASPANPTGTMLSEPALLDMLALVRRRDGLLIMDEIYQGLTYPQAGGRTADSVLRLADKDDPVYVVNSFSKYFGMTGWRLGWLVVPTAAVEPVERLAQNLFIAPSTLAQHAALAAFSPEALAEHEARRQAFQARRDQLLEGLLALGLRVPVVPDGAFYLYVDISALGMDAEDFCWRLLEEHQVAVTPGTDFGQHDAQRYVRFACTTSQARIAEALRRLGNALRDWA